jgi:hypothetical protein
MAGKDGQGLKFNKIVKPKSCACQQIFKDPAHGDDRGARVHGLTGHNFLMVLAADLRILFKQGDAHALASKVDGRGKPGHAGPHNDNLAFSHWAPDETVAAPNWSFQAG